MKEFAISDQFKIGIVDYNNRLQEINELRELNVELLDALKAVAGALTEREQAQAMSDACAAIAKAEELK